VIPSSCLSAKTYGVVPPLRVESRAILTKRLSYGLSFLALSYYVACPLIVRIKFCVLELVTLVGMNNFSHRSCEVPGGVTAPWL
jgi:hypothetical protein